MFTGIVAAIGRVAAIEPKGGDLRLRIATGKLDLNDVQLGDSIATNGVCLTVIELPGDGFWADVSQETITHTTLKDWAIDQAVNLEKALTPQTRLGGHMVSGHVDGVAEVVSRHSDGRAERFRLRAPAHLSKYIAHKGSITIDGTSLTVNAVEQSDFELAIVPHTLSETILAQYASGSRVNIEVDLIARYLERLLLASKEGDGAMTSPLTAAFLADHGFMK